MIEDLRELLKDDKLHLLLGQIKRLHLSKDRSYLKVEVCIWPENRIIIAEMTWESVGPESGFYQFPAVGDAVLCGSIEGDVDQTYILKRLSSEEDKIPLNAVDGHTVLKSLAGKKIWNTSDTRINLSKGDAEPIENIVLGQVFKATYSEHLGKLVNVIEEVVKVIEKYNLHRAIGNLGYPTGTPDNIGDMTTIKTDLETLKTDINTIKSDKVDAELILSDLAFTEK